MKNLKYKIKETQDERWGIYFQNRLLATIGNYEACKSIWESLNDNLSRQDKIKAVIAYQKAVGQNPNSSY